MFINPPKYVIKKHRNTYLYIQCDNENTTVSYNFEILQRCSTILSIKLK